jgi:cytochrome oxidase Cu insertion factor (SCO1/SenC/PrrC family)
MTRPERAAFAALVIIAAVTAAWWMLALWPLPSDAPYWLVRTREVCFGSLPDTLPSRAGWLVLIGEPLTMTVALAVLWPAPLFGAFGALARTRGGRVTLGIGAAALFTGAAAASARVASASARSGTGSAWQPPPPASYPRLDRPAPPLSLVDQRGDTVTLAALHGRPVLVTFAYAHCMSVCPVVVREALDAQHRLAARRVQLVVVTLDPWRDTPGRLPAVAAEWQLGDDAHVVSGDTVAVLRTLDAWNIPHARDGVSGEITHPSVVYLVDAGGLIIYAATPQADAIVTLAGRIP